MLLCRYPTRIEELIYLIISIKALIKQNKFQIESNSTILSKPIKALIHTYLLKEAHYIIFHIFLWFRWS